MSAFTDALDALSVATGPWLATAGKALTGTAFTGGAGVGVVDGPHTREALDGRNAWQATDEITVETSAAGLVAYVTDKTIIHDGVTYTVRDTPRRDSGMATLTASRRRTTSTGRQAAGE